MPKNNMGILRVTFDILDYFSTGIFISVLCNIGYTIIIDYTVSDTDDPWQFVKNYRPDLKSLQFYKFIISQIWGYIR